jgi:hypothetical protein
MMILKSALNGERIMTAVAILLLFSPVRAGAAGSDSLCLHFTGSNAHMQLRQGKRYTLNGTLPITICTFSSNTRYRLILDGPGLEDRIGTLSINRAGNPTVEGIRLKTSLRNALIPGWGTVNAGQPAQGWISAFSIAAALYTFVQENQEYRHLKNRYYVGIESLARAETLADKLRIQDRVNETIGEVNVQNKHRRRLAVLSAALYGFQILDPFISQVPPSMESEAGGSVVRLGADRRNPVKAILRSLVFPGKGQFYQGKQGRGIFFSAMSLAAGLVVLDYHNQYDVDANRYLVAVDRYDRAVSLREKTDLRYEALGIWDEVEDTRRKRNAAYIVLAGIWGLSIVDAAFPADDMAQDWSLSFDFSPAGCALAVRF